MDTLKRNSSVDEDVLLVGFENFLQANSSTQPFLKHCMPAIYLLDYRRGSYLYMSENFAGYKADCFLSGGIGHAIEIYHPEHLQLFNKEIFPGRLNFLKTIPAEAHENYIFSLNVCVRNSEGTYENHLLRNCFISDKERNPIYSMGILMSTNDFINGQSVVETISEIITPGYLPGHTFFRKVHLLKDDDKFFSRREKDVLKWMADGLSSKMIADRLNISEFTVKNHRRNMHNKTNAPNALALLSFAIKNGMI